jgi:hypothetical protein
MPASGKALPLALAILFAACGPTAIHQDTAEAAVVIRYEHFRTCSGFLGQEGQFFAYRIVEVENQAPTPFTVRPSLFRFSGGDLPGSAPVLSVPEFSDLEVAPGAREASTEVFLVQRGETGPPPRGPLLLEYAAPGVRMVHDGTEPGYEGVRGCDEFNT